MTFLAYPFVAFFIKNSAEDRNHLVTVWTRVFCTKLFGGSHTRFAHVTSSPFAIIPITRQNILSDWWCCMIHLRPFSNWTFLENRQRLCSFKVVVFLFRSCEWHVVVSNSKNYDPTLTGGVSLDSEWAPIKVHTGRSKVIVCAVSSLTGLMGTLPGGWIFW